jgi:hypothetical protein
MVQNISQQQANNPIASMGTINKVGTTQNGRIVYELVDGAGKVGGKISVGAQHADTFERSFKTITEVAPKIQKFQEQMTPRKLEKMKAGSKWAKWGLTLTGFGLPAIFVKPKNEKWSTLIQVGTTLVGTVAGFIAGQVLGAKIMTPPGGMELAKATQTLQKLDVQPYMGE